MSEMLFDLPPCARERKRPARQPAGAKPKSPAPHVCAWCGSELAPFGMGSPFDFASIIWACSQHKGLLG